MPWPFNRGQHREPSLREQVHAQVKGEIQTNEMNDPPEISAGNTVQFDFQVIEDEKILGLFDPNSALYCPLVMPLLPFISRLNFLSNCSAQDAMVFKLQVDIQLIRLKNRASCAEEYMLLDGLRSYLYMQINNSREGFKIRTLSTREKRLTMREEEVPKKKRGLW